MYYFVLGGISAIITASIAKKIGKNILTAILVSFILPMLSIAVYLLFWRDWTKKQKTQTTVDIV